MEEDKKVKLKKCRTCGEEKPETKEYFNIHKQCKDGLNPECKECRSKKARERRIKKSDKEGYKYCLDCKQELTLENFKTYVQSADGHYDICIGCQIKRRNGNSKEGHKQCKKCGRELPITRDYFTIDGSCLDGFTNICLECIGRKFFPSEADENWNEEDKQILIDNYYNKTMKEIIPLLSINRTEKAIKHMAGKLNLKKIDIYEEIAKEDKYKVIDGITYKMCKDCRRYLPLELKYFPKDKDCVDGYRNICKECKGENFEISNAHQWTKKELDILQKYYSIMTNKELQNKYLDYLTFKQIGDKAHDLDLYKTKETFFRALKETRTEEWKNKISKTHKIKGSFKGRNNPMYGSKRIGALNPNWKGGRRTEREIIMASDEYKEWRKQVFERDNYTCQCCNKMTHDVEAHHIENFANNPELRLNINNGITLCKKCHNPNQQGSFHNIYGTFNNTREQLEEYIENYKRNNIKEAI